MASEEETFACGAYKCFRPGTYAMDVRHGGYLGHLCGHHTEALEVELQGYMKLNAFENIDARAAIDELNDKLWPENQ